MKKTSTRTPKNNYILKQNNSSAHEPYLMVHFYDVHRTTATLGTFRSEFTANL